MTYARVPRWRVGAAAALSLVALAFLYASPLLLAAAVVPLGYLVYGAVSAVPADATLAVERTIHDGTPAPGTPVQVSLTVANTGEATLADVRVVDGVPDELVVTAGSPRRNVALRPGEDATISYSVVARRGEFAFDDAAVRIRSFAASAVLTETVAAAGDGTLSVLSPLTDAPRESVAPLRAGTHPTDSGGPGTEFRSTREYRPGDPRNRIHWRRYAKTGDLTTVSFREERAVRTVLVVDARPVCRASPRPGVPTGADLCGYAGERLYETLASAGAVTSVTALGVDGDDLAVPVVPGGFPWADGDADGATARAQAVFAAVRDVADGERDRTSRQPAGGATEDSGGRTGREGSTPPAAAGSEAAGSTADGSTADGSPSAGESAETTETPAPDGGAERARLLLAALPPGAEVVLLSPALDDRPTSLVRTLRSQDYPVTVLSPDVTGTGSTGGRVAGLERSQRLRRIEATGARTVDWTPGDPLDVALANSVTGLLGGRG